jgi:hypothetical protein
VALSRLDQRLHRRAETPAPGSARAPPG